LRIKEQETRLTLHEHDDDDDIMRQIFYMKQKTIGYLNVPIVGTSDKVTI
jgi:hypothetical protein